MHNEEELKRSCSCFEPFVIHKSLISFNRPTIKEVKQHPFYWSDNKKLEFICKVSGRIPKAVARDQCEQTIAAEFSNIITHKLGGLPWFHLLPQRSKWGCGNQKTPQQQFHTGVDGSSIGLLRFIRNVWVHRVQNIRDGHWTSEEEIIKAFLRSFPWLVTELYRLCVRYLHGELQV